MGIQKYLFFVGLLIATTLSFINLARLPRHSATLDSLKRTFHIFVFAIFLYILNFSVAIYNGFGPVVIFRQLFPILLFACGYLVVLEVSEILTPKIVSRLIVAIGIFSALNTFIRWSQLHGATRFSVERLGLDTDLLGLLALLLVSSPTQIMIWRKGARVLVSSIIVGFFFGTFSRSFIPVFAVISGFLFFNIKDRIMTNLIRLFIAIMGIAILVLIGFRYSGLMESNTFALRYLDSFSSLRSGGLSETGLGADPSLVQRKSQGDFAINLWQKHKFFGTGVLDPAVTMDNFMGSFAANGVIGMFLLIMIFFFSVISTRRIRFKAPIADFLSRGFLLILCVYSLIGNWPTNKSAWLTLLFILLMQFSEYASIDKQIRIQK